jgi:hypothetical protein
MERLGKNHGRYHGESVDIDAVQREIHALALAANWTCDTFLNLPDRTLRGYHRATPGAAANLYLSAGIHGDEPSGPLALADLFKANNWPRANIWIVPCLNPTGFRLNQRENAEGIDLNRDYRHVTRPETKAHIDWLSQQPPFDLTLILHEDWEANGFYVYELNPHNQFSFALPMVEAVGALCPIEHAERVDDFVCSAGIIRPEVKPEDRPQWAESLYLIANKSRQSYTLETPSDYPLPYRVRAHTAAVTEALRIFDSLYGKDAPEKSSPGG